MEDGNIDRKVSSNIRVKSKPPATAGPKESIEYINADEFEDILTDRALLSWVQILHLIIRDLLNALY
jgi:hypothetical protein